MIIRRILLSVAAVALFALAACADTLLDEDRAREDIKTRQESNAVDVAEKELVSVVLPIVDHDRDRITNISLAIDALQGKTVSENEEFSFNDTVGRRTEERGYKKAIVFVDEEMEEEVGGGICEVSSAIYDAALDAGFPVSERHEHQLPVNYAPEGRDATVYYGELDLKFINDSESPIRMDFHLSNDELTVTFTSLEKTEN